MTPPTPPAPPVDVLHIAQANGSPVVVKARHMPPKLARKVMLVGSKMGLSAFLAGANLTRAAAAFTSAADTESFDFLCDSLTASCSAQLADNGPWLPLDSVYDTVFLGNHSAFIVWLVFAVRWNYESFFDDLGSGKLAALTGMSKKADPSAAPTNSPKE